MGNLPVADFPNGSAPQRASQILDSSGNPFVRELVDPSSPAYAGGRVAREQGIFASPHVITFGSVLGSAYRTYGHRWDEAMRNCRQDALAMKRDAFLFGILQERKLASSQLNWHLEPEDAKDKRQKATCAFLEKIIRRLRGLPKMLYNLSDAIWYGRSGAHLALAWLPMERPQEIPGQPGENRCLIPCRYYPINGDKIQYRYRMAKDGPEIEDGTPVILGHSSYLADLPNAETVITDRGRGLLLRNSYWRERYIIHQHEPDDADFFEGEMAGGIHGVGVRSRVYWAWWMRTEWLSNVSDFIQKIGQGVLVVYYEAGNPESEAKAIQIANNISNNTVIVWPRPIGGEKQGAGVEKMDMPMAGSEVLIKLQQYMDGIIERAIIGQTASSSSEASGMGTHDNSAQMDTKFRIVKFDANNEADSLTHDFVAPLQRWNCPQESYLIKWVFDVDKPNAKEQMQALKQVWDMGASIKEEEALSTAGASLPQQDDRVLKNPQFNQQPGGAPGMAPPMGGAPGAAPAAPGGAPAAPPLAQHPIQPPLSPPMEPGAVIAEQPMDPSATELDSLMQSLLGGGEQFAQSDAAVHYQLQQVAEHFSKASDASDWTEKSTGVWYSATLKETRRQTSKPGSRAKRSQAEVVASVAKKTKAPPKPSAKDIMRRMVEHGRDAMADTPANDMAEDVRRTAAAVKAGEARYLDVVDFMAKIEDAGKHEAEAVARALGMNPTSKQDALVKLHGFMMGESSSPRGAAAKPAANFAPKIPVGLPAGESSSPKAASAVNWEKPWAHTLDEFLGLAAKPEGEIVLEHRRMIERALDRGEHVPADVLKDYPDLVPKPVSEKQPLYDASGVMATEHRAGLEAMLARHEGDHSISGQAIATGIRESLAADDEARAKMAPVGSHDFTPAELALQASTERKRKAAALIDLVKYRSSSAGPTASDFHDVVAHLSEMTPTEIKEVAAKLGVSATGRRHAPLAARIVEAIKAKRDTMGMHGGVRKFSAEDTDSIALVDAILPIIAGLFGPVRYEREAPPGVTTQQGPNGGTYYVAPNGEHVYVGNTGHGGAGGPDAPKAPPAPRLPEPPKAPSAPHAPAPQQTKAAPVPAEPTAVSTSQFSVPTEARAAASQLLGREATDQDFVDLSGFPGGGTVKVTGNAKAGILIMATTKDGGLSMKRHLFRDSGGQLVMKNEFFRITERLQGKGLGAQILKNQTDALRGAGVSRIETFAAGKKGDKSFNGYYTWPRLGYNATIPLSTRLKMPLRFQTALTLQGLLDKPGGAQWWKENGSDMDMSFDLTPGSRSQKVLDSYLAAKKNAGAAAQQHAAEEPWRHFEDVDLSQEDDQILDSLWGHGE